MTPAISTSNLASGGQELASQNLFEHLASQAQSAGQGASPAQLGEGLVNGLDGFLERSQAFAARADSLSGSGPTAVDAQVSVVDQPGAPTRMADAQLEKVAESLSRMFDHAIETQMVVRGATQISGAANTLLRGQ
ncbi:hypothetical protein [Pseudomonas sp. YJ42]|jgi:hypothetical protein|uniref:hypothetical protein n=1 Tax=Pseudomonas sp. YJ42 TaxID=3392115 RepID=UPI0039A38BBE